MCFELRIKTGVIALSKSRHYSDTASLENLSAGFLIWSDTNQAVQTHKKKICSGCGGIVLSILQNRGADQLRHSFAFHYENLPMQYTKNFFSSKIENFH